jgi:hypothetical protein
MRRRTWLVALAGLAVVGAAEVVVLWPRQELDQITQENCDRIREGMNREEVEAILGPPGYYATEPVVALYPPSISLADRPSAWTGNKGWISVNFDGHDLVRSKSFSPNTDGPLEKLAKRIERQWHRWFRDRRRHAEAEAARGAGGTGRGSRGRDGRAVAESAESDHSRELRPDQERDESGGS